MKRRMALVAITASIVLTYTSYSSNRAIAASAHCPLLCDKICMEKYDRLQ
jgi:hypothetical protein